MRIIPETRERIKKRRMEICILAACMLLASLYAVYQIAANTELFLSSSKVQLIMIVIFAFTVVCNVYFLILHFAYRKRRRTRT
jgi:nitrogen fixation/metabolism regulation signal transduction histidine kinase